MKEILPKAGQPDGIPLRKFAVLVKGLGIIYHKQVLHMLRKYIIHAN